MKTEIYADGSKVSGKYYTVPFVGIVESSRGLTVKPYNICYTIMLDEAIKLPWDKESSRTRILVNDDELCGTLQ